MDTSQMVEGDGQARGGAAQPAAGSSSKSPRRREYTLEFKRRIVEETFVPGASVSMVARQHDVNDNMLFGWRKQYREGTLTGSKSASKATPSSGQALIRVGVIDRDSALRSPPLISNSSTRPAKGPPSREPGVQANGSSGVAGVIQVELPNRVKLRFPADIDEAALRRVLAVAGQSA
jgi:transposase